MMTQVATAHVRQWGRFYREVPSYDLRAITAANLAMAAWLRSYDVPQSLIDKFTHLEGQTVARAFLIGLWHANEEAQPGGLMSAFKAKRTAATLPEGQARAQADSLRAYLLDTGVTAEVAELSTTMMADHSYGSINRELQSIQKALSSAHQREFDMYFRCLSDRMKPFLRGSSVDAIMVLVQHAVFRALLAGVRLGSST